MARRKSWPLALIGLPAAVAVWSGWVGLGGMSGFGIIHPLPGIIDSFQLNTAITLPIGVEAYGGYALGAWADAAMPERVRRFAFRSALGSLCYGLLGQVAYHLLAAAGYVRAPWPVVMLVSCTPVIALGFGMALHQLIAHAGPADEVPAEEETAVPVSRAAMAAELRSEIMRTRFERHEIEAEHLDAPPDEAPVADDPGPEVPGLVHPGQDDDRPGEPAVDDPAPDGALVPSPDFDEEAAALFAAEGAAPRPPARTSPPRGSAEWTPASVGRTEDEVARLTRTLSRNKLAEALPCSRGTADKLRQKYLGQPELTGVR